MSVNNQKNLDHDFLVEQAIAEGKRQAAEVEPESEITLEFSDEQGNMITELKSALTLSVEILLESAISYVHYKYKNNQNLAFEIEENYKQHHKDIDESKQPRENYDKQDRKLKMKLTLAAEITHKLEEIGITEEKINDCVITGINLLYGKLTKEKEQKITN